MECKRKTEVRRMGRFIVKGLGWVSAEWEKKNQKENKTKSDFEKRRLFIFSDEQMKYSFKSTVRE